MRPPRLPPIDVFSFWLGFAVAAVLGLLLYRFRRVLLAGRQALGARLRAVRERLTSGAERSLREDILRYAQTNHLAGSLFALDDIVLPPRVLVPEPAFDPTRPPFEAGLAASIPVMPAWPDLAAIYAAPTLSLAEALAGGGHLLILGGPGAGKTTLLAYLASRAAQADPKFFADGETPILVHAGDLALPREPEADVAQPLLAAAQVPVSSLTAAQLPRHLRLRLRDFRCVIFVDGFDELPPQQVAVVADWLAEFQQAYGRHRIIAAAGLSGYGPLLRAGLAPVHIAPWGAGAYRALISRWALAWEAMIRSRRRRPGEGEVDRELIMGWLASGNQGRTIFEVTLKTWAAFAGDARGRRPVDWLEAYLLRHGLKPLGRQGLNRLAAAMCSREDQLGLSEPEAVAVLGPVFTGPAGRPLMDAEDYLDDLRSRRLLARRGKDRLVFHHSLAAAYCVATALAVDPEAASPGLTPAWDRSLYFYTALGDLTPVVARRLNQSSDLLRSDLMACALWLRDAPSTARWRNEVFRRLSRLLMDANQPRPLRLSALGAFVAAYDATTGPFYRQRLTNPDPLMRQACALGLGTLNDTSVVLSIAGHLTDPHPEVRLAAVLALSAISHTTALEALAQGLLVGDDALRRGCAEALARNAEEGHPVLQEALQHENIDVRRAAVFGIAGIDAPWVVETLTRIQHTEVQWIVRSAAQEVLLRLQDVEARAPRAYQPVESQGWLVAWAAQNGLGVPSGPGALEVLRRALREGDELTQIAAAEAYGRLGDPALTPDLYGLLAGPSPMLAEAGYRALAAIAAAAAVRLAAPPSAN